MRTARMLLPVLVLTLGAAPVGAGVAVAHPSHCSGEDSTVVLDWETTSLRTIYTEGNSPIPSGALYLGFTSMAMANAVDRAVHTRRASGVAAAATAAHDVLAEYFPASIPQLDLDLAASLADVPDGRAEDRGRWIGEQAADAMIASRVGDGRNDTTIIYDRPPGPGVWQPPPGGAMVVPWLGYVRPLVLRRPLRARGPDRLTSRTYASQYDEVRRLGSTTSGERTGQQTYIAQFFNSNAVTMLSEATIAHLDSHPMSLRRTAHLFAAMHAAAADSVIAAWRLKLDVGFWRPVEAVAKADTDGNPATQPETGWTSLLPTPSYSEYVSGHAALTGPAAEVLRRTLGDDTPLTLHSYNTGTDETYSTISAIEEDALSSRIWGGLHFRTAMNDGYRIAHRTAIQVMARLR